jgi:hypothetical protein
MTKSGMPVSGLGVGRQREAEHLDQDLGRERRAVLEEVHEDLVSHGWHVDGILLRKKYREQVSGGAKPFPFVVLNEVKDLGGGMPRLKRSSIPPKPLPGWWTGPAGRENTAQGFGRRPTPWVQSDLLRMRPEWPRDLCDGGDLATSTPSVPPGSSPPDPGRQTPRLRAGTPEPPETARGTPPHGEPRSAGHQSGPGARRSRGCVLSAKEVIVMPFDKLSPRPV